MTDCPNGEMRDLLPDLLHDRLTPGDRARVESHVAACADCRDELALLRAVRGTLRRSPAGDVGAIVAALPAYRAPVKRTWGGWQAAAAITAIMIGGTSIVVARHEPSAATVSVSDSRPVADAPVPSSTSPTTAPTTAPTSTPVAPAPVATIAAKVATPARASARRELAVTGAVSDLSDGELASLLGDIETLDVLPSPDVDVTPLVPASTATKPGESR